MFLFLPRCNTLRRFNVDLHLVRAFPVRSGGANHRLNFNHPVKELIWVARRSGADPLEFAGDTTHIASSFVVGLKSLPVRYKIRPAA